MTYFVENWIDHKRISPKKLCINVVSLLVIGKSIINIQYALFTMDII